FLSSTPRSQPTLLLRGVEVVCRLRHARRDGTAGPATGIATAATPGARARPAHARPAGPAARLPRRRHAAGAARRRAAARRLGGELDAWPVPLLPRRDRGRQLAAAAAVLAAAGFLAGPLGEGRR